MTGVTDISFKLSNCRGGNAALLDSFNHACKLSLALLSFDEAKFRFATDSSITLISVHQDLDLKHFENCGPCKLGQIYWFNSLVTHLRKENAASENFIVCCSQRNENITLCAFLIGCYLILTEGVCPDVVHARFQQLQDKFVSFSRDGTGLAINDYWSAICHSKSLGWLDFSNNDPDPDRTIDLQEYFHYDNPINGNLHVIIPSKVVLFDSPNDRPDHVDSDRQWYDVNGVRHFMPAYYAEVLPDFDVKLVISPSISKEDIKRFTKRDISVETLGFTPSRPDQILKSIDRFLTLMDQVPGCVGLHCSSTTLDSAELLISSYLVRKEGFHGRSAVGWIRIMHPVSRTRDVKFSCFSCGAAPDKRTARKGWRHSIHGVPSDRPDSSGSSAVAEKQRKELPQHQQSVDSTAAGAGAAGPAAWRAAMLSKSGSLPNVFALPP